MGMTKLLLDVLRGIVFLSGTVSNCVSDSSGMLSTVVMKKGRGRSCRGAAVQETWTLPIAFPD